VLLAIAAVALIAWRWTHWGALPRLAPLMPLLLVASLALAVVFGGGAVWTGLALRRGQLEQAVRACAATLLLAFTAAMWLVMPVIDRVRDYGLPAAWVSLQATAKGPIGFFLPGYETRKRAGWLVHLQGRRLEFLATADAARDWLAAAPGRVLLADPDNSPPVAGSRVINSWTIGDQEWIVLVQAAPAVAPMPASPPSPQG
jgi:hypothetical protein